MQTIKYFSSRQAYSEILPGSILSAPVFGNMGFMQPGTSWTILRRTNPGERPHPPFPWRRWTQAAASFHDGATIRLAVLDPKTRTTSLWGWLVDHGKHDSSTKER
jgi:hypothetical protein